MKRTTTDPTIAIGYVRVSTDAQKLGPEAQRAAIESWARAAGVVVVAWHEDRGVSGAAELADRPGLVAALADLRARRAGVLVVAKRDRLARDVVVAAMVDRAVVACRAKVVAADGAGNGDSPADALMRTILDASAEYERALIRARVRAALAAKRARGERAGEVPYGFTADADGRLSPNAVELAVVAAVRELRAAGLSLRAIVDALAARGVVSRAGRPLALTQVARLARVAAQVARVVDLVRARAALAELDAALARPGPPPRPLSVDDVAELVAAVDDEHDPDHEPAPDPDAPPASTRRPRARRPPFVLHTNQRDGDGDGPA